MLILYSYISLKFIYFIKSIFVHAHFFLFLNYTAKLTKNIRNYSFTYLVLGPMSMVMIRSRMLNDDVFGGGGTEGRSIDTRGARWMMMACRLSRLRGCCSLRRGAFFLGLVASTDPAAISTIAAILASTTTPDKATAA